MRIHISVCSLLVCATLGLLARADPIRTKSVESIHENVIQDSENIFEKPASPESYRLMREYQVFKRGLMVEDDNGKLVEITLDDGAEASESEEMTRSMLNERVFFRLYTRKNPFEYQLIRLNDMETMSVSNFNADRPTHFVIHGWINSADSPACTLIRDAYLQNGDFNVIVIDWKKITMRPYEWAVARVHMVGQYVGKMIDFLESHANLDTKKTTLVGHSLGAHVMGIGGYNARGTINHIVGLDPALPLFVFADVGYRISNKDANHVQIIHTNAGLLGYPTDIGTSDFYPNGGSLQSGCFPDLGGACSHARSYRFFAESINTKKGFYAKPCGSFLEYIFGTCRGKQTAIMGGSLIDFSNAGKYFLSTRSSTPFAEGP